MIHHSFVVRICSSSHSQWHGQVVHTRTRQATRFVQLDALIEFIRAQMNAMPLGAADELEDFGDMDNPCVELNSNLTAK
jgi:hypothetical protein